MNLFPAIDLKNGECVRLLRGNMDEATVFDLTPSDQARKFEKIGCKWLHVVDLDGAFAGHSVNVKAIDSTISNVKIPIQLGGGIRDIKRVEYWLEKGISRVILGTAALRDPDFVIASCKAFPGRVVVGIDALNGFVAVNGWSKNSEIQSLDLAKRFENCGVAALIFTDIDRDGALQGVNIEATTELSAAISIPVIASGGVSSIDDLRSLKAQANNNIEGVICGRALYDGSVDLAEALKVFHPAATLDAV